MRHRIQQGFFVMGAVAAGTLAFAASGAGAAEPASVLGRAVSVHGTAYAKSPNEPKRILQCRDPIFEGDQILTEESSAVGVDSGSFYVRLGESSTIGMGARSSGAPRIDLTHGHVRVMNSGGPISAAAELTTPGLRVARTGPDIDALVFGVKATAVSMVCTYDKGLNVARRSNPAEQLEAPPGSCVVGKPREALYIAPATHEMLAVLMKDACADIAMVPVAGRFTPTSVELGPGLRGDGPAPAPTPELFAASGLTQPCSPSCSRPTPPPPVGGPGLPTQFPFVPPTVP